MSSEAEGNAARHGAEAQQQAPVQKPGPAKGEGLEEVDGPKPAEEEASVYYVAGEDGCTGVDCSHYRVHPFESVRLARIAPAPPQGQEELAELDARVEFEDLKFDFFRTVRAANAAGELWGVIAMKLIDGWGGEETCKLYSEECTCELDTEDSHETWTSAPLPVPVTFDRGGVEYTAHFVVRMGAQIVHGHCRDTSEPI